MITAAQAAAASVSTSWKWYAVLIGLGVLVFLGGIAAIPTSGKLWQLVEGADGRASTSKFQWLLWMTVIFFAYTVLWVLRATQGNYSAISEIPVNLLTVLGFSTGTAAAAKGITAGYVQTGRQAKPAAVKGAKGGLIQDDSGVPDLAKLQMVGFTLIAVGIFLATLGHQIASNPVGTNLPNIDSSLLVLMGISQGGYLGKKLVTFSSPILYPPKPAAAAVGETVTVSGANLGTPPSGTQPPVGAVLTLAGEVVPDPQWGSAQITFSVPPPAPAEAMKASLAVIVMGQKSNDVTLTITPTPAAPPDEAPAVASPAAAPG
jgi:hypothetical protein